MRDRWRKPARPTPPVAAGWEVEGFIDRLTRRDETNSEQLVLEAIDCIRNFSRDCDALRKSNEEAYAEIERLRAEMPQEEPPIPRCPYSDGNSCELYRWQGGWCQDCKAVADSDCCSDE